jgi:hypothetical protein
MAPSIRKSCQSLSPTSGSRLVGIVRSRTQTMEFFFFTVWDCKTVVTTSTCNSKSVCFPHRVYLYISYNSQSKTKFLPRTTWTYWSLSWRRGVFPVRYGLDPFLAIYTSDSCFVKLFPYYINWLVLIMKMRCSLWGTNCINRRYS